MADPALPPLTPDAWRVELDSACRGYLPWAAGVSVVAWLPYVFLDARLHPEVPVLPWIRAGFTVASLAALALLRWSHVRPTTIAGLHASYLLLATGVVTGLVDADAVYIGGYCMVLVLAPVPPLPRHWMWAASVASLLTFVGVAGGLPFASPKGVYSQNDLATGAGLSLLFVYLMDSLRRHAFRQKLQIAQDRDQIDGLLRNILPASIATELRASGRVEPRRHEEATVLFTDFVGFTASSAAMPPEELVALLHRVFLAFDRVTDRFPVEKLKTMGDAYMCVAGVPTASPTHAVDAVRAALALRDAVAELARERAEQGLPMWAVRVGVHSGPVVSGVVGQKKFVFDVWGDTVNTAQRMESAGAPGEVNVSAETARRLGEHFVLEPRGAIPVKGKGALEMYFVRERPPADPGGRSLPRLDPVHLGAAGALDEAEAHLAGGGARRGGEALG